GIGEVDVEEHVVWPHRRAEQQWAMRVQRELHPRQVAGVAMEQARRVELGRDHVAVLVAEREGVAVLQRAAAGGNDRDDGGDGEGGRSGAIGGHTDAPKCRSAIVPMTVAGRRTIWRIYTSRVRRRTPHSLARHVLRPRWRYGPWP